MMGPIIEPSSAEGRWGLAGALRLLEEHGRHDAIARLHDRRAPRTATIVVVGEASRGKSSLVNALLGVPIAPVAPGVTTAVTVVYRPADDELAVGQARVEMYADGEAEVRTFDAADLAAYVTVDGAYVTQVRSATVATESVWLPDMTLIDTPGTGGLDAAHRRSAVAAARAGDVLLLVTSAGTPLIRAELDLLREAGAALDQIVVAVAKTDLHPTGWREVADETLHHLRAHVHTGRTVALVGVTADGAELAGQLASDPQTAEHAKVMLEASGIPELASAVRTAVRNAVAERGLLLAAWESVSELDAALEARMAALTANPDVRADVEAEQRRLADLRASIPRLRDELRSSLRDARLQVVAEGEQALRSLRQQWRRRIDDKLGRAVLTSLLHREQLSRELADQLTTILQQCRLTWLDHHARIVNDLHTRSEPGPRLRHALEELRATGASAAVGAMPTRRVGYAAAGTFVASVAQLALEAGIGVAGAVTGQVWAAALVVGLMKASTRIGGAMREELQKWLEQHLDATAASIDHDVERVGALVLPHLLEDFETQVARRQADLAAAIAAAEEAVNTWREVERQLRVLDRARGDIDRVCDALSAGLDATEATQDVDS